MDRIELLAIYNACRDDFKKKHRVASPSGYYPAPKDWTIEDARELAREGLIKMSAARTFADRKAGTGWAWRLV